MTRTLFTLALILWFMPGPIHLQAQDSSTREKSQPTNSAVRAKAFNLLESLAGQVSTLQSAENRARLGANIADSLWIHDEKRARALLAMVENDIKTGIANRDLDDPQDFHTLKVFLKLRVDTVARIAKYDAELAFTFLKATEFTSDRPAPKEVVETERGLEIRLAKLIAKDNPDLALKVGRQSLAQGFSEDLIKLLTELNRKHKEQALTLYKDVVNKLRDADLETDWDTWRFAEKLLYSFNPPKPNDPTFRELVGIFVTRALAMGCAGKMTLSAQTAEFCRYSASMLPQMEKIDPRAAQLKHWVPDRDQRVPAEAIHELYEIMEEGGTIEDLLEFAPRYPEIQQDVYWEAVRRATNAGDLEEARKILTHHIADSERKQAQLAELDRRTNPASVNEKLAEIQSQVNQFPKVVNRVYYLLTQVSYFAGYDHNTASKLLKQATEFADTMQPGKDQTNAQIAVAMAYCSHKNDRGFAIMESLMPKLNELVDAAVKLDGYETRYVRDGEWNMSANGIVGDTLTRLSRNAGHFAWCDFDRAVSLSAQFERSELRLMAQVKLAQAILAGPPKRTAIDEFIYRTANDAFPDR